MRFEHNKSALDAILHGPEMLADLKRRADAVKHACGDGYESAVDSGSDLHAAVYTYTAKAIRSNAKHNTLVKNLHAGG